MFMCQFAKSGIIVAAVMVFPFCQGPAGRSDEEKKADGQPQNMEKEYLRHEITLYQALVPAEEAKLKYFETMKGLLIKRGAKIPPADKESLMLEKELAKLRSEHYRLEEKAEALRMGNDELQRSLGK